jgi:hypothetical protein
MILMLLSVLPQVHSLFQRVFSTERHLVLPLSVSSVLSFPYGHPVAAYVVFLFFPSLLSSIYPSIKCFRKRFLHKIWPIQLSFLLFIVRVCRIFLSSCVLRLSFLTQSVQLMFSTLLQHHISNLSIYYIWYNKYSRWIGRDEEGSFRNFEFEGDEDNRRDVRLWFVSQEEKRCFSLL